MKNDMQLLITSRCKLKNYDSIEIKELDKEKELTELFYKHCPSAKRDPDRNESLHKLHYRIRR